MTPWAARVVSFLLFVAGFFGTQSWAQRISPAEQTSSASELDHARLQLFGGVGLLSTGFAGGNGAPLADYPVGGWDVAASVRLVGGLRFKADLAGYYGIANYGGSSTYPQLAFYQLYGPQYAKRFGRHVLFVEGLAGERFLNRDYSAGLPIAASAFQNVAYAAGVGLDSPLSRNVALRIQTDYLYTDPTPRSNQFHYGYPTSFARVAIGFVIHGN